MIFPTFSQRPVNSYPLGAYPENALLGNWSSEIPLEVIGTSDGTSISSLTIEVGAIIGANITGVATSALTLESAADIAGNASGVASGDTALTVVAPITATIASTSSITVNAEVTATMTLVTAGAAISEAALTVLAALGASVAGTATSAATLEVTNAEALVVRGRAYGVTTRVSAFLYVSTPATFRIPLDEAVVLRAQILSNRSSTPGVIDIPVSDSVDFEFDLTEVVTFPKMPFAA